MMNLEKPISKSDNSTYRNLCGESVENEFVLKNLEGLEIIQNIDNDLKVTNTLDVNKYCEDIVNAIGTICSSTLLDGDYDYISNEDELKKAMSDVLIRFDTDPDFYTKDDYQALLKVLLSLYSVLQKGHPIFVNGVRQPNIGGDNYITISGDNQFITVNTSPETQTTEVSIQKGTFDADDNSENEKQGIATVYDIRNYINSKLSWKIY